MSYWILIILLGDHDPVVMKDFRFKSEQYCMDFSKQLLKEFEHLEGRRVVICAEVKEE